MSRTNLAHFDGLPAFDFFKNNAAAASAFRDIHFFPDDALGFDPDSEGFLVLHRGHSPSGLHSEIPGCLILKKLGFRVILIEELPNISSPDVLVDDIEFEMKCIANAKRVDKSIDRAFSMCYKKSGNLLLHLDQRAAPISVRNMIYSNAKIYGNIRHVWLIFRGQLWPMDRKKILERNFGF